MTPLAAILHQRKLTHGRLALQAGVCRTTVWAAANGTRRVSFESYFRMAEALGITLDEILPEDEKRRRGAA